MTAALPDLCLDEVHVGAPEVLRVEHRACHPVRVLRRPRTLAEERRLLRWIGVDTVVTAGGRRREDEVGNASRMIDDEVLCDETAHRGAEHGPGRDAGGIEHSDRIERHRRHGHVPAVPGLADASRVVGDHPVVGDEMTEDRVEHRPSRTEAGDEEERGAIAGDDDREGDAVSGVRGEALESHDTTIAGGRCRTMDRTMPRFFIDAGSIEHGRATLTGPDAEHLARSLRARPGETLVVVEGGRVEHGVVLDDVSPARVSGAVAWSRPASGEPRLAVHVLQAIPAHEMDATIEALVVAGAASVRPVLTARTVPRLDPSRATRRLERWRAVAREAAQLAGRAAPPDVHPAASLPEALASLPPRIRLLACAASRDAIPISGAASRPDSGAALVIGPEGGLDTADLAALDEAGAVRVHLGPRTLPSRLAGAVATALLLAGAGDLDSPAEPAPI